MLFQLKLHRYYRKHPWKSSMRVCVTWSQKAKSPPGCSAVDFWLEELTHARWFLCTFPKEMDKTDSSHLHNYHALTSKPSLTSILLQLLSPGRLWRPPGVFRGEWEMVPGGHCELGRGLCSSEQARRLLARHQVQGMDQAADKYLMVMWGTGWVAEQGTSPVLKKKKKQQKQSWAQNVLFWSAQVWARFTHLAAGWEYCCMDSATRMNDFKHFMSLPTQAPPINKTQQHAILSFLMAFFSTVSIVTPISLTCFPGKYTMQQFMKYV